MRGSTRGPVRPRESDCHEWLPKVAKRASSDRFLNDDEDDNQLQHADPWKTTRTIGSSDSAWGPDFIVVLPLKEQETDTELLTEEGKGSASWFLNQVLIDAHAFESFDADVASCYANVCESTDRKALREGVAEMFLRCLSCRQFGFKLRAFTSANEDEVFVAVTASENILRAHAERLTYRLQLDRDEAVRLLGGKFSKDEISAMSPPFLPFDALQEEKFWAEGEKFRDEKRRSPFTLFYDKTDEGSVFNGADRLRIISAVIGQVFSLQDMVEHGFLTTSYPCHNQKLLRPMAREWLDLWSCVQMAIPVSEVNEYFGERVAFRMCFLNYLSKSILPLAILAPFITMTAERSWAFLVLGSCLIVWAAVFHEHWKRTESRWRMVWGMDDFSSSLAGEQARPRFRGEWKESDVDHRTLERFESWGKRLTRRTITSVLAAMFNLCVIATTLALYALRSRFADGQETATKALNCVIALQMQVYNQIWNHLVIWLLELDNYETETEYYEAFVSRSFNFNFINSYCSLFYVAFVKHFVEGCGNAQECVDELGSQLRIFFGIDLLFHFLFALVPYAEFRWKLLVDFSGGGRESYDYRSLLTQPSSSATSWSYLEAQAKMPEYGLAEEIADRVWAIIELGYVLLFGLAAPEVLTLFLLSNVIHVRILGWKLTHTLRRPFPHRADGIGEIFHSIYQLICRLAVVCNIVLVLMYNAEGPRAADLFLAFKQDVSTPDVNIPRELDWKPMLAILLLLERLIAAGQVAIDYYIPDIPFSVRLEHRRREVVERQWLKKMVDDPFYVKRMPDDAKQVQVQSDGVWKSDPNWVDIVRGTGVKPWNPSDDWFECVSFKNGLLSLQPVSRVLSALSSPREVGVVDSHAP